MTKKDTNDFYKHRAWKQITDDINELQADVKDINAKLNKILGIFVAASAIFGIIGAFIKDLFINPK